MPAVADAVAGLLEALDPRGSNDELRDEGAAVVEASFGGLVKCPECKTLNAKSAAKCKKCGHDMKQVADKAKEDGRSHVSEAVAAVLEGEGESKGKGRSRSRSRRGKFADLPTLATGKRAAAPAKAAAAPSAAGSAEAAGPTAVAEATLTVLEADGPKMKLTNKPGKTNWVENAGGLPDYIKRIAEHVKGKNPGWDDGRAIAVAVNSAKKMCASGDTNLPGAQTVNAGSKAEACAAVASWEAKKGKGKVSEAALDVFGGDEYDLRQLSPAEHREVMRVYRMIAEGGLEAVQEANERERAATRARWIKWERSNGIHRGADHKPMHRTGKPVRVLPRSQANREADDAGKLNGPDLGQRGVTNKRLETELDKGAKVKHAVLDDQDEREYGQFLHGERTHNAAANALFERHDASRKAADSRFDRRQEEQRAASAEAHKIENRTDDDLQKMVDTKGYKPSVKKQARAELERRRGLAQEGAVASAVQEALA